MDVSEKAQNFANDIGERAHRAGVAMGVSSKTKRDRERQRAFFETHSPLMRLDDESADMCEPSSTFASTAKKSKKRMFVSASRKGFPTSH